MTVGRIQERSIGENHSFTSEGVHVRRFGVEWRGVLEPHPVVEIVNKDEEDIGTVGRSGRCGMDWIEDQKQSRKRQKIMDT